MEFLGVLVIAAFVFGICFLIDKGFQKLFRRQAQYHSGTAVRLNKKFGAFGVILAALGVGSISAGIPGQTVLIVGGTVVSLVGIGMIVYYMTSGIYYDEESFIYTAFGKRKMTYYYQDIEAQQLYNASGNILVELYMTNGNSVMIQSAMNGAYDFLDRAFSGWCAQRGIAEESCDFHDPANSCWFPPVEDK